MTAARITIDGGSEVDGQIRITEPSPGGLGSWELTVPTRLDVGSTVTVRARVGGDLRTGEALVTRVHLSASNYGTSIESSLIGKGPLNHE